MKSIFAGFDGKLLLLTFVATTQVLWPISAESDQSDRVPALGVGAGKHTGRGESTSASRPDSQALLRDAALAAAEGGMARTAPTRASFIANWQSVSGAAGYRLDVSRSSSFSDYVNGYQNLDLGSVTGR